MLTLPPQSCKIILLNSLRLVNFYATSLVFTSCATSSIGMVLHCHFFVYKSSPPRDPSRNVLYNDWPLCLDSEYNVL